MHGENAIDFQNIMVKEAATQSHINSEFSTLALRKTSYFYRLRTTYTEKIQW